MDKKADKVQYLCDYRFRFPSLKQACRQMSLARSTYYYRLKREEKALEREREDADLKSLIDEIHLEFPYYGYRPLKEELRRRGRIVNHKRIRRLQKKFGLFPVLDY